MLKNTDRRDMIEPGRKTEVLDIHVIIFQVPVHLPGSQVGIVNQFFLQIHRCHIKSPGSQVVGKQRGTPAQVKDFLSPGKTTVENDPDNLPVEKPGKQGIVGRPGQGTVIIATVDSFL